MALGWGGDPVAATIGLDLGTTDIKAIAFDAGGAALAQASRPSGLMRGVDGAAELDPEGVYAAAMEALAEVVTMLRGRSHTVARIGLSGAMHSMIPVGPDGTALAPAMTWADLRPQPEADALWQTLEGRAAYARTGTPIHAMSPLAKLLWMRRAQPEIFQRAVMFAGLKEWLWRRWFGEWAVDTSLASATGLYNLQEGVWDAGALALTGVTPARLPRVAPETYARDDLAPDVLRRLGLERSPLVAIGGSDGALANLGVGALDGRRVVVTIGTSLAVRMGVTQPAVNLDARTFCYVAGPGRYVAGAASNTGGATLDWLYQQVLAYDWAGTRRQDRQETDGLAVALDEASRADAKGLIFLPYIAGERAPLWTDDTTGALLGLRASHTAADVLRATVEGLIFNADWLLAQMRTVTPAPEIAIVTGGVFRSEWIAQLAADVFGLPVTSVGEVDASTRGAALVAEIAAGARTWEDAARGIEAGRLIAPRAEMSARYREKSLRFRALVGLLGDGAALERLIVGAKPIR